NVTVTAGSVISTRQVAVSADPTSAPSVGKSGPITVNALAIAVGSGAELLAGVGSSPYAAGDVRLDTQAYSIVRVQNTNPPQATITLDHATVTGNEVALTADAAEHFGLFGWVKQATAKIDIGDSKIVAGNVDINALADTRLVPDVTSSTMSGNPDLTFTHN